MVKKIFVIIFSSLLLLSCTKVEKKSGPVSWYIQPKQNTELTMYGVAEGFTLEEATKAALSDAAARLIVSISSTSTLVREENNYSANEEMRSQIKQNIEKIDFVNFKVARSAQVESIFYVEVEIDREQFLQAQKDKLELLNRQISDLSKNIPSQNLIQKRNSYVKEIDLLKQASILVQILNNNMKETNAALANAQNELNKLNNNVEFYFDIDSSKEITAIIRNALNKEAIKISKTKTNLTNQIQVEIDSSSRTGQVYGSYITKIKIDFENKSLGKVVASNSIEVSGSSTISEREAYLSAIESLKEKVANEGILQILGIL